MFAGKMKLTTFLTVLVVGGVCGTAGFAAATFSMTRALPDAATLPAPAPAEAVATLPVATPDAAPPPAAPAGARELDTIVLGYIGRDIGTDKLKDVTRGKPFKVNVYQDAGSPTVNRLKVDLDRDDKWDEKYTFKDGTVTRDLAPADDEVYTISYRWSGTHWAAGH